MRSFIISIFFILTISTIKAEEFYAYKKVAYGSEFYFNPINYYFNIAYDVTRNNYYFHQRNAWLNHKILWNRIKNPDRGVKQNGGYKKFFKDEIYGLRASPNYSLHLLGGGYDFRRLEQWYKLNGYTHEYIWALLTSLAATIGNEALETTHDVVQATDHIADLFIFDIAGRILFLNEDVLKFFHEDMGMRNWSQQPMVSTNQGKIFNAGTNYILRPDLFHGKVKPLIYATLGVMVGASYQINDLDSISAAAGVGFTDAINFKGHGQVGFFYDENGSLLSSLFLNTVDNLRLQYNLYPGILKFGEYSFGLMAGYDRGNHPVFGVDFLNLLGAGYKDF